MVVVSSSSNVNWGRNKVITVNANISIVLVNITAKLFCIYTLYRYYYCWTWCVNTFILNPIHINHKDIYIYVWLYLCPRYTLCRQNSFICEEIKSVIDINYINAVQWGLSGSNNSSLLPFQHTRRWTRDRAGSSWLVSRTHKHENIIHIRHSYPQYCWRFRRFVPSVQKYVRGQLWWKRDIRDAGSE